MRVGPVFVFQCCGAPIGIFFHPTLKKNFHIAFPTLFAINDFPVMDTKNFKWQLLGLTSAWETRNVL